MGALSDVTLGDIFEALKRYRPALATVAALVFVLTVVLPDPPRRAETATRSSFAERVAGRTAASTTATVPVAAEADGAFVPDGATSAAPSFPIAPASGTVSFSAASASFGDDGGTAGGGTTPREDVTFAEPTFVQPGAEQAARAPLRIVAKAWHTRSAGTPVAAQGVPPGTLPVGTRATVHDKVSFVRLAGDDGLLRLAEDPAGNRTTAGAAAVQLCQVTRADWPEGEARPIQEAPPYDAAKCVNGSRGADGTWTFDLSSFDTRTDNRGFAMVPGAGASPDFQVAFRPG